jgi:multidrug efflux pump subunit AcrB
MKKLENFILDILSIRKKMWIVLGITLASLIVAIMLIPTGAVLAKMLPGKDSNTFNVYIDLPEGSSVTQTQKVGQCVVSILQKEKEVLDIELFLGSGSPLDFAGLIKGSNLKQGEHIAEVVVNITKPHHRHEASFLMVHRLRPIINETCTPMIAGTSVKMVEPPAGPPTQAAVVAEIYGEHGTDLRTLADEIASVFKQTDGLVDIDTMKDALHKKYEINIDSEKVARSGLTIKQVNEIVYLAFEGMNVAVKNSRVSPDQIPVHLVLSEESKMIEKSTLPSITSKLSTLKLMNKKGDMIALNEVVSIKESHSNPMLMSKNLKSMVAVVAETDLVSQIYPLLDARSMIKESLADKYEITSGSMLDLVLKDKQTHKVYNLLWDGELKVTLDTFAELGGAFIAALIMIFLLMVIYYKSFAYAGIVLAGSFLSIIGVIVGHMFVDIFTSETFFLTATSLIGFIALIGISSRNSLLLIDFTFSLVEKGMKQDRAIAVAVATRAKPIFLTAVAIILASTLLAGDAVFGGLGVSLIFGTIAAVAASLLVVPVLMHFTNMDEALKRKA